MRTLFAAASGYGRMLPVVPLVWAARAAPLVHHGGSGTTAAPLSYGVPQLVLPAFADDPLSAQARGRPWRRAVPGSGGRRRRVGTRPRATAAGRAAVRRRGCRGVSAEMAMQPSPDTIMQRDETTLA